MKIKPLERMLDGLEDSVAICNSEHKFRSNTKFFVLRMRLYELIAYLRAL